MSKSRAARASERDATRERALEMEEFCFVKPVNSTLWFRFPTNEIRTLFVKNLMCIFCTRRSKPEGFKRVFDHIRKCGLKYGEFSKGRPAEYRDALEDSGELNEQFVRDFYEKLLENFGQQLKGRKVGASHQATRSDRDYTTIKRKKSTDPKLDEMTILVNSSSPEVTNFVGSALVHKKVLNYFGCLRLRSTDTELTTAKESEVRLQDHHPPFTVQQRRAAEQTAIGRKGFKMFFIEQEPKEHRRTENSGTLFDKCDAEAVNVLGYLPKSDTDFVKMLSKKGEIIYPSNDTGGKTNIGYFRFSKIRNEEANFLRRITSQASGITEPEYYTGMTGSFFPLHTEDIDMQSANQLKFGKSKIWFVISARFYEKLVKLTSELYELETGVKCANPLRHKSIWMNLKYLDSQGIPYTRIEQKPGDTIILDARAAHCGYNSGGNLSQAINFLALEDEQQIGEFLDKVIACDCGGKNIQFDDNFESFKTVRYHNGKWVLVPPKA